MRAPAGSGILSGMDLGSAVRRLGGTATRRQLVALGYRDRDLARAVATGLLHRARRGRYALPSSNTTDSAAARVGGVPTCASLLRQKGIWVGVQGAPPHVLVVPGDVPTKGVVLHWSRRRPAGQEDSVSGALRRLGRCAGRELTIASVDSALRLGLLSEHEFMRLPKVLRDRADPRCESGGETLVRLRLAARRIRFDVQVPIAGVGRVDFVVGDRLVIEVDGYAHHGSREAFEHDRDRDLALVAHGYLVIRVSQRQILEDWDRIERAILAIVRSRRHRWPRGVKNRTLQGVIAA